MPRYRASRATFIPQNFTEKREGPTKGTEIYLYTDAKGRPCAKGFRGRAQKSTFHHHYGSEATRETSLARWIKSEQETADRKAAYSAKMKKPHSLKVGEMLVSSWGYEQTNVDFYKVVDVPSQFFVILQKVKTAVEANGNLSMQGYATPSEEPIGEPFKKKPDGENCVTLTSYSFARPWSGKPRACSWYG